jgi:prepilin-type N-terminal cleavage/methylation domain-containing protein
MRRNSALGHRGFTLAELLIAVAITVIIVGMLGRVLIATTTVYSTADQRMDAFRDAKAAIQLMTTDLSRADINGDPGMLNLAKYSSDGTYATEAYAVTPIKNKGKSTLCAVGYYLDWNGTSKTYSLRRFFKDSDTTIVSLAKTPPEYSVLYDRTKGTSPETIASYVWDLQLRPGRGATPVTPGTSVSNQWNWIEIRFKAMSVKAGQKLGVLAAVKQTTWDDPTSTEYKQYILPNEQQFVTRVSLFQTQ